MRKNIFKRGMVTLVIGATVFSNSITWANVSSYNGQYIGPGTFYSSTRSINGKNAQTTNVIESIYDTEYIKIEGGNAQGPIKNMNVLKQAQEKNKSSQGTVIGAINGDYFDMKTIKGLPYGTSIIDGEIRTAIKEYSVFGVDSNNKPFIEKLIMDGRIRMNQKEYAITTVNRLRWGGQLVVYTSAFGETTQAKSPGTDIVVTGMNLPLKPNAPVTGNIVSVNVDAVNTVIPKDGIVISIENGELARELATLQVGQQVDMSINFNVPDIIHAIGGDPRLLEGGSLSSEINTHITALEKHPRSAIGIKDNRVVMVALDGRRTGTSNGMNLPEFAAHVKSLGVQNAITFDGGGSTTLIARMQGNKEAVLANSPSETSMRNVGNSVQIVSYAPISTPEFIKCTEYSVVVNGNNTYTPKVYAMDKYLNKLANNSITWAVEGNIGIIDANGLFKAGGEAAKGKIIASIPNGNKIEIVVEVKAAKIVEVPVPENPENLEKPVVEPSDKSIIESFDTLNNIIINTARAEATASTITTSDYVKSGSGALKLDYSMNTQEEGASAIYMKLKSPIEIPNDATAIGMWVYGDGASNWLRAYGNRRKNVINFTAIDGFNWMGWQYVKAYIPQEAEKPFQLEEIYFVQTDNSLKKSGTIYFDEVKVLYEP